MDALKTWLEQNWDMWIESPPPWFTTRFIKRFIRVAPPEALPMSVLKGLAEKYSDDKNPDNWSSGSFSSRESKGMGMMTIRNVNSDSRPGPSRDALVRRETKRRRLLASSQRKNHFLWVAALFCGYADLITTVLVAFAYLRMGTEGRIAAYLIFGVLAGGLSVNFSNRPRHVFEQPSPSFQPSSPLPQYQHTCCRKPLSRSVLARALLPLSFRSGAASCFGRRGMSWKTDQSVVG